MPKKFALAGFGSALLVLSSLLVSGCGGEADAPVSSQAETSVMEEVDHSQVEANLAQLPPEDRKLAEKQQVCLLAGEPLGSMGVPIKIDLKGKPAFLCCAGCEEVVRDEPDKYAAKRDQLMANGSQE